MADRERRSYPGGDTPACQALRQLPKSFTNFYPAIEAGTNAVGDGEDAVAAREEKDFAKRMMGRAIDAAKAQVMAL